MKLNEARSKVENQCSQDFGFYKPVKFPPKLGTDKTCYHVLLPGKDTKKQN